VPTRARAARLRASVPMPSSCGDARLRRRSAAGNADPALLLGLHYRPATVGAVTALTFRGTAQWVESVPIKR
jgi:hypothetical protein